MAAGPPGDQEADDPDELPAESADPADPSAALVVPDELARALPSSLPPPEPPDCQRSGG